MGPHQIWRENFNLVFAGPGSTTAALTAIFFALGSPYCREWQKRIRANLSAEATPAGSKEIRGDDADMWKPDRWLGNEKGIKRLEDRFVVFSKGPRGCGGKEIAMLMMEKTVVGVLEKWILQRRGP